MTLHCLNCDAGGAAATELQRQLFAGDAVLLLGAAAALAWDCHPALPAWLDSGCKLYVLAADFGATGLSPCHEQIHLIDHAGWVALSEQHPNQQAWY